MLLLAAEALLVYGGLYNGCKLVEGYARVHVAGRPADVRGGASSRFSTSFIRRNDSLYDLPGGIDPGTGLPFFVFRFITFGSAPRAHTRTKQRINCTFTDEVSKQFWMTVATEALVVFGSAYNGFKAPNRRYTRVELNDEIYTLEDFGYKVSHV